MSYKTPIVKISLYPHNDTCLECKTRDKIYMFQYDYLWVNGPCVKNIICLSCFTFVWGTYPQFKLDGFSKEYAIAAYNKLQRNAKPIGVIHTDIDGTIL